MREFGIRTDGIMAKIEEISTLYKQATTKGGYEEVVELREKTEKVLINLNTSPDRIFLLIEDGYWAEYYLLLKNPDSFTKENLNDFVERIIQIENSITIPTAKAELLYLKAVVYSSLMNDQDNAEICNNELREMVSAGKCLIVQMLKSINARMIKAMGEENWEEAFEIGNELEEFPEDLRTQSENIGSSANILSNRGASKVRGNIDIESGLKDLVVALDYYLKQVPVPMNHIEGIRNRMMEATKKMK